MFFDTKVLLILLYLLLLHRNGSARACPAGQNSNYNTKKCEKCPNGRFKPTAGDNIYCENCSKCRKGSEVVNACTSTSDTQCRCMKGFTAVDEEKQIHCTCKKGSGVDQTGKICQECSFGFFTDKDDTSCRKWKECKSGVKFQGNTTSDVVCQNETTEVTKAPKLLTTLFRITKNTSAATSTTPLRTMDSLRAMTTLRTMITSRARTTLKSMTTSRATPTFKTTTYHPCRSFYIFVLVIICAIIFLISGLFYFKSKFTRCIHNLKKVDSRKESVCRKPVEESGEKCLSLLV